MWKLLKYEFRKTLASKLILLGLTAGLEGYFLYGIFTKDTNDATRAAILLGILAVVGILFIGIQSIVSLHRDMNTKQSYMLFMTPHSNYAILGAKAMECTLSVAMAGLFFFGLGALDISILFNTFGQIESLVDFSKHFLSTMRMDLLLDPANIAIFVGITATSWIETVMVAFLADVIATALLKGKKFGGIVSFVFFLALSAMTGRIIDLVPDSAGIYDLTNSLLRCGLTMVIAAAEYVGTATIMEKKLSV